jgi:hypothetical protein
VSQLDCTLLGSDFNGDSQPDLLWRQKVNGLVGFWYMNGTGISSAAYLTNSAGQPVGVGDPNWKVVGTGRFRPASTNANDILWFHLTTRQIAVWYLTNSLYLSSGMIVNDAGPEWKLVGAGDFNGDGWSDLLWQDEVAGQKAMWFMQDTTRLSTSLFGGQYQTWPQTKMSTTGRFDGDNKSDIVWRGTAGTAGAAWIWYMDGATVKQSLQVVNGAGQALIRA